MNYYPHHIGDYAAATEHLTWAEDMAYTRLLRVYYRTEAPLPGDVAMCCRLIRATSKAERTAVQAVLAEFFTLTEDGYRQKRCDEEIERAHERSADHKAKTENERERQKRARERRQAMFDQLREHGIIPKWDTTTAELEAILSRTCHAPVTRDEPCTGGDLSRDLTRLTKSQNQNQNQIQNQSKRASPPVDNSTIAGRTCATARAAGVDLTPANPLLMAWLAAGMTDAHLAEAIERARLHKPKPERIPARYLDPIVREVITGPPARAAPASAWWASESETQAKGKELGLWPRGGESWDAFRGRIKAA